MPRTLTLEEASNQLFDLPQRLTDEEAVIFTRDGCPVMVALSYEHYEGLMETLEILSDLIHYAQIVESIEQVGRGETVSLEEVKRRLGF